MFDENQIVQMKWNGNNRKWFESKGYVYTNRYDVFDVVAKDLPLTSKCRVIAICDYCGNEYETSFTVLMNGRKVIDMDCCPHCTGKKASDVSRKKRAKKYIAMAQSICVQNGYTLLPTEDDYTEVKMDVHFICPKHGEQTMILDNLIRGHKCIDCSYEERGSNLKHDIEYVKECIESVNGNKLLNPEDYQDTHMRNLNILCSCGNVFTTSFSNYTKHGVNTCFSCSCKESVGEKRIHEFLELHNIAFEQEKRFEDCRDVKPLPFDFYLPEYNTIIEFDGNHHFEENGLGNHEITKQHDAMKNEYCDSHNIHLVRIPYWDGNRIEEILTKELNL